MIGLDQEVPVSHVNVVDHLLATVHCRDRHVGSIHQLDQLGGGEPRRFGLDLVVDIGPETNPSLKVAEARVLRQIGAGTTEIGSHDVPVETYIRGFLERLAGGARLEFKALFDEGGDRAAVIGLFLALLELVRLRRVRAFQDGDFGEIALELRGETPPPDTADA